MPRGRKPRPHLCPGGDRGARTYRTHAWRIALVRPAPGTDDVVRTTYECRRCGDERTTDRLVPAPRPAARAAVYFYANRYDLRIYATTTHPARQYNSPGIECISRRAAEEARGPDAIARAIEMVRIDPNHDHPVA